MYSKGGVKYEDLNRNDMLSRYTLAKKKNLVQPEHKDINRFKTYKEFEDVAYQVYDSFSALDDEDEEYGEKPEAKKVFENDQVLIIVPENEAAACKYGRNTRWCTAAMHSYNYFNQYNRTGPLYILIPKNPRHDGEKYQLHFSSNSYMDEDDYEVDLYDLVNNRFGEDVKDFFANEVPETKDSILFIDDSTLEKMIDVVLERVQELVWEEVSEWEANDDGYYQYLRDEGFMDEDGDIDWEKVEKEGLTYSEYNPEVERVYPNITRKIDVDQVRESSHSYNDSGSYMELPEIIGYHLMNDFYKGDDYYYTARNIGRKISNYSLHKYGETYQLK